VATCTRYHQLSFSRAGVSIYLFCVPHVTRRHARWMQQLIHPVDIDRLPRGRDDR
jgi:hypothetical protein